MDVPIKSEVPSLPFYFQDLRLKHQHQQLEEKWTNKVVKLSNHILYFVITILGPPTWVSAKLHHLSQGIFSSRGEDQPHTIQVSYSF